MKKILFILGVIISIFFIYYFNRDTSVYYLVLGEKNDYYLDVSKEIEPLEKINNNFLIKNATSKKVYNQLKTNVIYKNQTIKNALIKADLVSLYLEYNNLNNFDDVDKEALRFEKLMKLLRKSCKEEIIVIGPNDDGKGYLKYLNKKFRNISFKYDIEYQVN